MKKFYDMINRFFSYSRVRFLFLTDLTQQELYILLENNGVFSLFDTDMNLLQANMQIDENIKNIESCGYVSKGQQTYQVKKNDKPTALSVVRYSCSNSYASRYDGLFLGVIKPNAHTSFATCVNDEKFVPVSLFNSQAFYLQESNYKQEKGHVKHWATEHDDIVLGEDVSKYSWVLFFHGNDDSHYYARFKTYYDAITAWEIMKENDVMADKVTYDKKADLKEAFERQDTNKLFYFHQN